MGKGEEWGYSEVPGEDAQSTLCVCMKTDSRDSNKIKISTNKSKIIKISLKY